MASKKRKKAGAITAGICTSGSRVKLSVLTESLTSLTEGLTGSAGDKFYCASKKARNQEKVLFAMFDRLLGVHRAGLKDISTLCVITGPGRFTGLRVGLTLAGALKTLAGVTVYSSTLFEVLAAQAAASKEFRAWAAGRKEPRLAALVHAFKNEYFCQIFEAAGHDPRAANPRLKPAGAPRWLQDGELARYLGTLGADLYVIADAEEKPDIYSLAPGGLEKAPARISRILPEFVIKTGLALRDRNLRPLYLKPAKYELEQRGKAKAP